MARRKDAVESQPGLAIFDNVDQYVFAVRHDGQTLDETMQALKALVIFLGVLIVIGMSIFAYGVAMKIGTLGDGEGDTITDGMVASRSWERIRMSLPAGTRVVETIVADGRMVVRLVLADDRQRYLVFDLDNGVKLGEIDLEPEGGAQ